jgi:hypothetical protein
MLKQYLFLLLFGFGFFSFPFDLFGISNGIIVVRSIIALIGIVNFLFVLSSAKGSLPFKHNVYLLIFMSIYLVRLYQDSTSGLYNFDMSIPELFMKTSAMAWIPLVTISFTKTRALNLRLAQNVLLLICLWSILNGFLFGVNYRLSGNDILNPITLGLLSGMSLITTVYNLKNSIYPVSRYLILLHASLASIVLYMSLSRGALISTILVIVFIFGKDVFKKKSLKYVVPIISLILLFISFGQGLAVDRLTVDFGDGSANDGEARVALWLLASDKILAHPFFGSSVTTSLGYVHNIYLESLMALGIVGSLLLFIPIFKVLRYATFKSERRKPGLVVYFFLFHGIACLFSGTIYNSEYFWITLPAAINDVSSKIEII